MIKTYPDPDALAAAAADLFISIAKEAVSARARFTVALSGGSTPKKMYGLLATDERRASVDFSNVFLFFGDERFVDGADDRSNYAMARAALIDHVPVPANQVFPVDTSVATAGDAADRYEQTIASVFGASPSGEPPRFDLILLGLGDDGHTASLFPGAPALSETYRWVVASPPGVLPPPVDRITFTFPLINAARNIAFLVSGTKKAAIVQEVLERFPRPQDRPSAGIKPVDGNLYWLLDADAAALIS